MEAFWEHVPTNGIIVDFQGGSWYWWNDSGLFLLLSPFKTGIQLKQHPCICQFHSFLCLRPGCTTYRELEMASTCVFPNQVVGPSVLHRQKHAPNKLKILYFRCRSCCCRKDRGFCYYCSNPSELAFNLSRNCALVTISSFLVLRSRCATYRELAMASA